MVFIDLTDKTMPPVPSRVLTDASNKANIGPAPRPEGSKKRKSTDAPSAKDVDIDNIDVPLPVYGPPSQNCDQVRRKITRLLDSGEVKVGEFCNIIGCSSNALSRFRGQSGPHKGDQSDVYIAAYIYFQKREIAGVKLPLKKKQKTDGAAGTRKSKDAGHPDISDVHLPGEEYDGVPVYETCDEVRKKINAYLRKPEVTQAEFCRDLYAQLHSDKKPSRIQSSQLGAFRSKKGPSTGNTSSVFYAAYVFFEKIRIAEGKPKSKHREEMESIWPGGFDVERPSNRGFVSCAGDEQPFWCLGGERPHEDKYGQISFS